MEDRNWGDSDMRCFGMLMDGRAQTTGIHQRGHEVTLLLIVNGYFDMVAFTLPDYPEGSAWRLLIDTNFEDVSSKPDEKKNFGDTYDVTGRSLLLFELDAEPAKTPEK